jgi:hypothetical protein
MVLFFFKKKKASAKIAGITKPVYYHNAGATKPVNKYEGNLICETILKLFVYSCSIYLSKKKGAQ